VVSMLASGTRVRGFDPDRSRTVKILSMPSFGAEVKYVSHVPALRHVKDPSNCSNSRVAS
jgi:hypothetical protein